MEKYSGTQYKDRSNQQSQQDQRKANTAQQQQRYQPHSQ